MKRSIKLDGVGTELVLSKVAALKIEKKMIVLEELKDGTWRLNYTADLIPDITKLTSLTIIRED